MPTAQPKPFVGEPVLPELAAELPSAPERTETQGIDASWIDPLCREQDSSTRMPNPNYIDIMFSEYAPDFGGMPRPEQPGYLTDCINLRSTPNGYRGRPSFADVTSASVIPGSTTYGLGGCFYIQGTTAFFFMNSAGSIYESRGEGVATWLNVTPSSGAASLPYGDICQFGNDVVWIVQSRAPLKKALTSSQATLFTNLGGSPPTALHGARIRNHLVLGNLSTADPYGVRTSAIGDHEDWPTVGSSDALAKESIYESLNPEYGQIQRVMGGEKFGIVMQDHALTRMTYVGGSTVYEFDTYERIEGSGLSSFFSRPVTDGRLWYWYDDYGIYATDGYSVKSVSEGKIDEALFNNTISHPQGSSIHEALTSAYDPRRSQILFGSTANSSPGSARYQLCYNVTDGSIQIMNDPNGMAMFSGMATNGAAASKQIFNIDAGNLKLQRLDGATGTIALQTGYMELAPGRRVQIQGAHLLGAGVPGSLTLAYKSTSSLGSVDVSQSGFTSLTAPTRGMKSVGRATDQFFAFRVTGTGAESQLLKGIRVYFTEAEPAT